jgi:transporter family protein
MRSQAMALLLGAVTIISWGLWGFFGKLALARGLPVVSQIITSGLVATVAGVAFLLVYLRSGGTITLAGSPNPWAMLTGIALIFGLICFYAALAVGAASVVVPMTGAYPLVTVLLSVAFLGERLTLGQWLGLVLVLFGMILLGGPTLGAEGPGLPRS